MKTHSIIQRCQVYFVTVWWCFPLSCPFSTFLFPACFSFYSIFFFLLPLLPFLPYPFLSLFLPSSSLYKVLKLVLTLRLILDFNLYLIFSGTTKYRHIVFCCPFFFIVLCRSNFFFFFKEFGGSWQFCAKQVYWCHFSNICSLCASVSCFGNSCNISNSFIILFVVLIYYQLNLMLLLQKK